MGRKVMNRRNWCQVKPDDFVEAVQAHKWQFILHVEADYQQDQTELRTAQYPISVLPLLNSSERELLFLAGNKEKSL
jgi:hypothetical protein